MNRINAELLLTWSYPTDVTHARNIRGVTVNRKVTQGGGLRTGEHLSKENDKGTRPVDTPARTVENPVSYGGCECRANTTFEKSGKRKKPSFGFSISSPALGDP